MHFLDLAHFNRFRPRVIIIVRFSNFVFHDRDSIDQRIVFCCLFSIIEGMNEISSIFTVPKIFRAMNFRLVSNLLFLCDFVHYFCYYFCICVLSFVILQLGDKADIY